MNDDELFHQRVKDLHARLDEEGKRLVFAYMGLMRAIIGDAPDIHLIYAAIALDLITAERFSSEGKAQ